MFTPRRWMTGSTTARTSCRAWATSATGCSGRETSRTSRRTPSRCSVEAPLRSCRWPTSDRTRGRAWCSRGDRFAFPVRGRTHVQDDPLTPQALSDPGYSRADHAVSDPLYAEFERFFDVGRIARLTGMACEMQPCRSRGLKRLPVRRGPVADLITGQVEADDASAREPTRDSRQVQVLLRRVLAHRAGARPRLNPAGMKTGQHGPH